jgi:hypothetical protein
MGILFWLSLIVVGVFALFVFVRLVQKHFLQKKLIRMVDLLLEKVNDVDKLSYKYDVQGVSDDANLWFIELLSSSDTVFRLRRNIKEARKCLRELDEYINNPDLYFQEIQNNDSKSVG